METWRWARAMGFADPSMGHRYGAEHVEDLLGWCAELGIDHVTVFVCSRDNLLRRRLPARLAGVCRAGADGVSFRLR